MNTLCVNFLKIKIFICRKLDLLGSIISDPKKYISIVSWTFIIWLIFGVFDPFGFDASADRQSYMVAERALSPFHDLFNPEIRDQITVVLLKEEDQEKDEPWPPKYSRHGNIIASIIEQKPRAFFADITFQTNREDNESINNMVFTIKDAMENNPTIPVFIGSFHQNDKTPKMIRDLLPTAYVSWEGSPENYPLLGSKSDIIDDKESAKINYPAFSIFMELCKQDHSLNVCGSDLKSGVIPDGAFDREMEVRWLSSTPPLLHKTVSAPEELVNKECHNYENKDDIILIKFINRLYTASRNLLIPVTNAINQALPAEYQENISKLSCPPFITLSTEQATSDRWKEFIENKIVFFGHHLFSSRDSHETPAHGYMPGVYIHAMALENLLQYGSEYSKISDDYIGIFKISDVIELIIVIFLSLLFLFISDLKASKMCGGAIGEKYEVIFVLLMIFIIIFGAITISIYRLLPHSNLIAIAAMAFLIKEHASWEWGRELRMVMLKICFLLIVLAFWTYVCSCHHWNQFIWALAPMLVLILSYYLPRVLSVRQS